MERSSSLYYHSCSPILYQQLLVDGNQSSGIHNHWMRASSSSSPLTISTLLA